MLSPRLGNIVDSGIGLLYKPASLCILAGLYDQRESRGLLEYQALPSLRDVAHDGVLCTFSNRSTPDQD
jgi:hypothetical protein